MSIPSNIIYKLKEKDESAFDYVYDKYNKLVYYIAYEILNDSQASEDVLQETFIKLMDNIDSYEDQGNFKQYLCKIAKNIAINEYQRRKAKNLIYDIPEDIAINDDHQSFELIITLDKYLEKEESQIVKFRILYDYSFKEISQEMNLSIGIVQSKYYNALKKLKNYFKGER